MSIDLSINAAKPDKLFYIVAGLAIVNQRDKTCLLLKRDESEKVFPGKWAFPGGKLEHRDVADLLEKLGQAPIDGVDNILARLAAREAKEECGLNVSESVGIIIKDKVFIRPDNVPVFMVTIASKYIGGEVVLEEGAFTDYAWVKAAELDNYDCIDDVKKESLLALKQFA